MKYLLVLFVVFLLSTLLDLAIMGAGHSLEQGPGKTAAAMQHPEHASSLSSQSRAHHSKGKLILEFEAAFSLWRRVRFADCAGGM